MGSLLLLLIGFGVGAYYGQKYPEKVTQAADFTKKTVNDIKEQLGGKKESS